MKLFTDYFRLPLTPGCDVSALARAECSRAAEEPSPVSLRAAFPGLSGLREHPHERFPFRDWRVEPGRVSVTVQGRGQPARNHSWDAAGLTALMAPDPYGSDELAMLADAVRGAMFEPPAPWEPAPLPRPPESWDPEGVGFPD